MEPKARRARRPGAGRAALALLGALLFLAGGGLFATGASEAEKARQGQRFASAEDAVGLQAFGVFVAVLGVILLLVGLLGQRASLSVGLDTAAGKATVAAQAPAQAPLVKLKCRACGVLAPEESRFCGSCAQPL